MDVFYQTTEALCVNLLFMCSSNHSNFVWGHPFGRQSCSIVVPKM